MPHPSLRKSALFGPIVLAAGFSVLFLMAWLLVRAPQVHAMLAIVILAGLFVMSLLKAAWTRAPFIFLASYLSFAYFVWRTTETISYRGPLSFTFAIILYAAELYGLILLGLSNFVNIRPHRREAVPPPADEAAWPTVDVFIPTYNEDFDIVETTALAALQIDYPKGKLRIHILDDGGTEARLKHADPKIADMARERRRIFGELCSRHGMVYIAREKNTHAKAGNLNAGLRHSRGDLVLILDADHVPTSDILKRTVGAFVEDPKLFLLQTPHFFGNPDPIEKNLRTFGRMPGENEMFYSGIQLGLDQWDGAFFCGSAAVLRRRCLELNGGFAGESITEDAETALTLHANGWHSAYLDRPMVCGLACESIPAFLQQRCRWGTGMLQIFLLKNPLLLRGLSLPQRLCYMSSCFFWFFPFSRIVFLFAPVLFLLFGLQIFDTDAKHFLTFAVPHMFGVFMLNHRLFGRLRWAFIGDIYEIIQTVPLLPAMLGTLIKPRAPIFKVTAKGETLERDNLSDRAKPYLVLFTVNVLAIVVGFVRAFWSDSLGSASVTMFWAGVNCLLLVACIGVMLERRQLRAFPRLPAKGTLKLSVGGVEVPGVFSDLSNTGAGLRLHPTSLRDFPRDAVGCVIETQDSKGEPVRLHADIMNTRVSRGDLVVGIRFTPENDAEKLAKIRLVYGDSGRWVDFLRSRRANSPGVFGSLLYVVRVGGASALEYFGHRILGFFSRSGVAQARPDTAIRIEEQPVFRAGHPS